MAGGGNANTQEGRPPAGRRAVLSWVLYDWAYGAFTTLVSTFVFATYFTQAVAPDPATGASLWAAAQAASRNRAGSRHSLIRSELRS